jgi:hypothetical protein
MNSNRSRAYSKTPRRKNDAGLALLSVLWVLLLLSALASTAMYVARINAILTHRALEIAQAQSAADAAIVDSISRLSDRRPSRHPPTDGSSLTWEFDGMRVALSITNEAGRIDVNTADRDLILAFLESQGVPADIATTLMNEVRDPAQINNMHYKRALRTTEELRQFPSWKSQPLDCWMESLTVYSGLPGISLVDATPATRAALQWAQVHHLGDHEWASQAPVSTVAPAGQSILGESLRIRATATVGKDVVTTSEWVGRLTGDPRKPMLTMHWGHVGNGRAGRCASAPPLNS